MAMRMLLVGLACGALVVGVVWLAWPRPSPSAVLQTYAALERAPIPVEALGWINPVSASAQISRTGYVLVVRTPELGDVTIAGNQDPNLLPLDWPTWRSSGGSYALRTAADWSLVQSQVVPLSEAEGQLTGNWVDTPVLYLWYVPLFAAFSVWSVWSLLR